MPDQQSHATAIRSSSHSVRVNASVFVGAVVAQGEVIADALNDTYYVIVDPAIIGDLADALPGQEVLFYSPSGDFKGRTHISFHDSPIGTDYFTIRELSFGTFQILDGDTYQILREFRLHDRLVGATEQFPPDLLPYSLAGDPNLTPFPVACSGGAYAAYVDGFYTQLVPEIYATVQFTGSTSYTVDPASSGSGTHAWRFPVGSTPGTSAAADPSAQIPVGSWIVEHDFTDDDNSQTTTQYIPVMIHDATHLPYQITLENGIQTDEQYGWRTTARIFQDADLISIPDGSLIMLWTDERIGGVWQSFGNATPGRESMLVVGYLQADTNSADATIRKVSFDIVSPLQRLDLVVGYSKVMTQAATPDAWSEINTLSVKRAIIQLLYFYTTFVTSGFDFIFDAAFLNKLYPALYLQRSTPLQEVRELCHGVDARLACDPSGRFDLYTHPAYIPLAERDAVTVTFILALEDIIDFSFTREHFDKVELLKSSGFSAGLTGNQPIFSIWPGVAPGEATDTPVSDRLICGDETDGSGAQTDLNERTGRYGALANMTFINADGLNQRAFEFHLTLYGSYNFFRLYKEYVKFTLDGSSNLRGVDISSFRFWVKSVQISYDGGTARTKLVLVGETNAPTGTTFNPQSNTYFPPTITPSQPPISLVPNPGLYGRGMANLALFNNDGGIYYTNTGNNSGQSGGVVITAVESLASLGMSGTLNDFTVSAFSANYLTGIGAVDGWIASDAEVRKISDIFGSTSLSTAEPLTPAPTSPVQMDFERSEANWGGAVWYSAGNGIYFVYTTDGTTWTIKQVTAFHSSSSGDDQFPSGFYIDPHVAGLVYVGGWTANAHPGLGKAYQISGHGAGSPSVSTNPAVNSNYGLPVCLVVPYTNSGDTVFYSATDSGAAVHLMRVIGAGPPVDISPISGGHTYGPVFSNRALSISPTNPNVAVLCGWDFYDGSEFGGVWRTENLMDAAPVWTVVATPASGKGVWRIAYVAGNDPNTCYLLGVDGSFGVITRNTLDDRSASIHAAYPGAGDFVGLCGRN